MGAVINSAEPVCVVLGLVLSLVRARLARQVVAGYADLLALGSCAAIACGPGDADGPSPTVRRVV